MSYQTDLRAAQNTFLKNLANLIFYIQDSGYTISGGELWRSEETQAAHVKANRSKTMDSQHLKRLAIDLNIFDGEYLLFSDTTRKDKDTLIVKGFADNWCALHQANRWGGEFKSIFDPCHFEMYV